MSQQKEKEKLRKKLQFDALSMLIEKKGGTVVMSPGTGKSKVAIDYAKKVNARKILITSPRDLLKENWNKELVKWGIKPIPEAVKLTSCTHIMNGKSIEVVIENVQTTYKWNLVKLATFDLIIADEIHTMVTEEYGKLFMKARVLNIEIVGLTGTPDDRKWEKKEFYRTNCPIIYRYLDSAKDGVINKRKYIVYEHTLTDDDKIEVKTRYKSWMSTEAKQYGYISSEVEKGEELIRKELLKPHITELARLEELELDESIMKLINIQKTHIERLNDPESNIPYFAKAKSWYWTKNEDITGPQKTAGGVYMRAISYRQEFLWNLTSTRRISKTIADYILEENNKNKVLIFSERTDQANSISKYTVHSKNDKETNKQNLLHFDEGKLRQLGSCYSLTLGLNLERAGHAIMESYNGSSVQFDQRSGRVDRLPISEDAIVIIIVPKDTQAEKWFTNGVKFNDHDIVNKVSDIDGFKSQFSEYKESKSLSIS